MVIVVPKVWWQGSQKKALKFYFHCVPLKNMVQYIDLEQQGTYEKLIKIEVDIVSDNGS